MKKLVFLLAFLCALAVSSFAQTAQDITVSGILYNGFNDPCTSCTFTVTVTRRDGVAVQSTPRTVTSHASTGAVSFTLPRKSFVTFTGNYTVGRYNWRSGISMFLPDQSTIDIVDIQSVEDAVAALVAVSAASAAPSDAQYVVGTANGTLSAEQSLGALTTGLLKNTVVSTTGTLSTAVAGTDYVAPGATTSSGLTMATARILGRSTASTGAIEEISIGSGLSLSGGTLSASGGGAVSSVFGRTGAVTAATNDYTWAQIDKTTSSLADITTRSASDLSSGTLPDARFPATLPAVSGANLTNLNASNLAGGTVPLARLSGISNAEISVSAAIALSKLAALTVSRALVSDGSGVVSVSPVTSTELGHVAGVTSAIQTQIDAKQASDADLTAIAALSPANDDLIQRKAGAWTNRTPAQFKTDLALTKSDVGLGNAENTALSTWAGSANITTLGTIVTGVWNGSIIGSNYGGAGTINGILKANGSGVVSAAAAGTDYVAPGATTSSGLTMATARILGRSTASTGAIEEISIGSGLSLSGGTLSASGGGAVSSVFGRTGAVTAATNDYTWAQIDKTTSSLADITTRSASDLSSGTLAAARGGAGTISGILKANGSGVVSAAAAGTDYESPLTFSTGLTRSTNTITVNTSQNIATLSNLTSNGLVTTSGGDGTLGVTVPGSGVLTALAVNTGSAGAFVVNGGALGTPSGGTLTNATGLPISTGVSGLGTGVATFLATPSSANLASAITDETGSGALVFGNSPTISSLNAASTVSFGTGTGTGKFTGVICASAATATTSGTTEETVATCTIPANSMSADAKGIRVTAFFSTAATANNKTIKLQYGATVLQSVTKNTASGSVKLEAIVMRDGATSQKGFSRQFWTLAGTWVDDLQNFTTPGETLSGSVDLTIKLTTATAAAGASLLSYVVEFIN